MSAKIDMWRVNFNFRLAGRAVNSYKISHTDYLNWSADAA